MRAKTAIIVKAESALPERDYTQRRGEISAFGRAVLAKNFFSWLLVFLVSVVLAITGTSLLLRDLFTFSAALIAVTAVVVIGAFVLWRVVTRQFIEPELATRKWIQQICDGELDCTIDLAATHPHFEELNFHTRNVGTSLKRLSDEMDSLVENQTRRLASQNRVLELLFQLTSDVAHETDQESVLNSVCTSLADWLGNATVGAYMKSDGVASLQAASDLSRFSETCDTSFFVQEVSPVGDLLAIPISRGNEIVGVLLVSSDTPAVLESRESQQVFKTLSEQLSMFVSRHYVLESVQQASLVKQRAAMGAEIHDSLAQTLLACRYQIRMLREALEQDPTTDVLGDVRRVEGTIDEANVEVRELIGETRKSTADHSFTDSMLQIVDEHNKSSGITAFFQTDNPHLEVTSREATVARRIVREALTNANKYANATAIRVYFRVEHSGTRSLLIEDDGDGFVVTGAASAEGEESLDAAGDHIGLSIMRDRAMSIGAILSIDSEPGEGTRISLTLPPLTL